MLPVPGYGISTPYGRRGSYWSCNQDSSGNGIHTGADFAAPTGAKAVAARPGTVAHVNYGSAFGYHQLAVRCSDGTEDFYAHLRSRVASGTKVDAGQKVGEVGAEGNVTGPHLHFERHRYPGWSCSICVDPAPSIDYQPAAGSGGSGASGEDEPMPKFSRTRLTKALKLAPDQWTTITWDHVSSGEAGEEGQAAIYIGPSAYTATLLCTFTATGDVCRTRFIERQKQGAEWVTSEEYPNVEHPVTPGMTYVSDTRTQNVPKDTRLVCQVNLPDGGTLETAELDCLYF